MDPGNERDEHAGTGDDTRAWTPGSNESGWGPPAGSVEDPGPARRRPVVRSAPGPTHWDRPGSEANPASSDNDRVGGPEPSATGATSSATGPSPEPDPEAGPQQADMGAEWLARQAGANDGGRTPASEPFDPTSAGPPPPHPDDTDVLPAVDPEDGSDLAGAFYGTDPAYAPEEDYGATGIPIGTPEVWGTSSYDTAAGYPLGGYDQTGSEPASSIRPPVFPTDPDAEPFGTSPRRRTGVVAVAAVGALALLGGGVAAAVTLRGPRSSPVAISNTTNTTQPPRANRAARDQTSTTTGTSTTPASTSPTTFPATTAAPSTTRPTATAPTTVPPTTPVTTAPSPGATVALGTWTAQELDLILQIKNDLTNLNRDLDVQPDFSLLTVDATDLQQDLAAAQSSPLPNDPAVAAEWSQLLRDMGASNHDLDGAIGSHDANIAQDLRAPVTITDTDYNNLSHTLNATFRHSDFGPGQSQGQSGD